METCQQASLVNKIIATFYNKIIKVPLNLFVSGYERHQAIYVILYVITIFAAILYLNWYTPYVADDFAKAETAFAIHSADDFVSKFITFYKNWGGRIWGEVFTWTFLLIPKNIFNVINSLGYIILVLLLYFNILGRCRLSGSLFVAINFALLACLPAFGQDILWLCGAANYLWASIVPLFILALCRFYYEKPYKSFSNPFIIAAIFLLSIFAGWGIELLSVGLIVIIIGYMMLYHDKYGAVPLFSKVSLIGVFIGSALLWFAPGNFVRAAAEHFSPHITTKLLRIIRNVLVMGWLDSNLLLCMAFGLLCFIVVSNRKMLSAVYVIGAMTSAASLGVIEPMKTRTYFVPVIFMIVAVGIMYTEFSNEKTTKKISLETLRKLKTFIAIFLVAGSIGLFWEARDGVIDYAQQWNETMAIINEQKSTGNLDVLVNDIPPRNRFCAGWRLSYIHDDPKFWVNRSISRFYGINTIKISIIRPLKKPHKIK